VRRENRVVAHDREHGRRTPEWRPSNDDARLPSNRARHADAAKRFFQMPLFMHFATRDQTRARNTGAMRSMHRGADSRPSAAWRRRSGGKKLRRIVDMHKKRD
jgi:hypothetical protein